MKKILTLSMMLAGLLILLVPGATFAQEQVASLVRGGNARTLKTKRATERAAEELRFSMSAWQKRKSVLRKYLASVSPSSTDYQVTERSLAEIDVKVQDMARELVRMEFPSLPSSAPARNRTASATREASPVDVAAREADAPVAVAPVAARDDAAATQDGELTASAGAVTSDGSFATIKVDVSKFDGDSIKVEAQDSTKKAVWSETFDVKNSDRRRGSLNIVGVQLVPGADTTVVVTSVEDSSVTFSFVIPNPVASASTTRTVSSAAQGGSGKGGAVGYTLGGVVVSQQAQNFNQADPFFGFTAGYSSDVRGSGGAGAWRWNLRFQGIFTADGRTAEQTETADADGGAADPAATPDPFKFIASRKTFDVDAHMWVDFWAKNAFSIGPYIAWGASTVMDKNELSGEAVIVDANNDGQPDNNQVATNSKSDNDLKQFREYGMLMNLKFGDNDRPLFLQAILARGWYEALKDLDDDDDSRHRFIGKLRVFPEGLGFMNKAVTPMFGVELNAGTGPDQVKFFTGFAVRLKGLSITGK